MKESLFILKNRIFRSRVRNTLKVLSEWDGNYNSKLKIINNQRRVNIVLHAFDTCPFYSDFYRSAGFNRSDLMQIANFERLPILTRNDLKRNFRDIFSKKFLFGEVGISSTGGSTGMPVSIGTDPRFALDVISWRRLNYWGASPSDNAGYIYRAIPSNGGKILRSVFNFPTKRFYLSAVQMTESSMRRFAESLTISRSRYFVSYVGSLIIFADFVKSNGWSFPDLKFVWSTASPLPKSVRVSLESIFGVPVYSQYGSCEFYWIASERVDRQGHDVDWDVRHLEIVDGSDKPVEGDGYGKIIVSDLINFAFPLIRYEIGDRSRLITRNDSEFPILDYVMGRTSQILTLKDGRKIPGEFWTTIFDDFATQVDGFYVHQNSDYSIEVGFKPNRSWTGASLEVLRSRLNDLLIDNKYCIRENAGYVQDRGKVSFVSSDVKY